MSISFGGLMHAGARRCGTRPADEFWRTLRSHAATNGAHALFAGDTIYTWGLVDEAEVLWWAAADQGGRMRFRLWERSRGIIK